MTGDAARQMRRVWVCTGLVAWAIGVLLFLPRLPSVPPASRLAELILKQQLHGSEWTAAMSAVLPLLTRGTPFENRWQINQPPRKGFLNVIVLRRGTRMIQATLPPELDAVIDNCAFMGEPGVVVCDGEFLERFAMKHGLAPPLNPATSDWRREHAVRGLLLWVLGHEIGHVVGRHVPSHFRPKSLEQMVASASVAHQQELDADLFCMQQIRSDEGQLLEVTQVLIDLLNNEIRRKATGPLPYGVGLIYDYRNGEMVRYARSGSHPEFVVRCVRLLQQVPVDTALKGQVDRLAARMREGQPTAQ